ncbi:precorrin-2 C(20)-methyltransferase [Azospirillum sp. YIM DDC1]|uniref:Precorrin-2 C(20)-methyltransferase n=1 Tax=Azospirillum aestuarii TaxID=2802052 RepID=A0ABS1I484_9PROT|nr:precorrin-2 C(20)-methyltransferase [Azospirillum aestuarii]MBK3778499.1 precorrin-2 C(20)-methyltransferase [Azospirillum brasilense]MBK4721852.1 precorrin-2 C(20)-methyltransferase [Azospirillum aestuarii]TWA85941.1 precorrin-2/cobalt-factor-2 C20-methyltransferase [Azospirillum brasilense]
MSNNTPPTGISTGTLYGVSVGPGDPDLMTVRAMRTIGACPVVAYFCKRGTSGQARRIADGCITAEHIELPMVYPVTVELPPSHPDYGRQIEAFFDESAERLAEHLAAGRSIAALNEGDAFFYGSFMHLFLRLASRFPTEVVPGVTSMMCSASLLPRPLTLRDDVLAVIPGTLGEEALLHALRNADAAVIMKLGQNLPKVRRAVEAAGLADRAWYIERASMADQRVMPFREAPETAPYFSQIVIPGEGLRR